MVKIKVIHDRPVCIGCGACAAVAPGYWEMNGDGKSDLKNCTHEGELQTLETEAEQENTQAAELCPVNCIHIEKDKKRII